MVKPKDVPDLNATTGHSAGPGDLMLAAARQERQRSEIQAKLSTMLDALRVPASVAPSFRGSRIPSEPSWSAALSRHETAAQPVAEVPLRRAGVPAIELVDFTEFATLLQAGRSAPRTGGDASLEAVSGETGPVPELAPAPSAHRAGSPPAAAGAPAVAPGLQGQIDALTDRLDRLEAASLAAAGTLDSLVSSVDHGQRTTFAAAQAAAREEARSVVAQEVHPAIVELDGASAHAREEIHAVLTLLGSCLERVVGHLQKLEGVAVAPSAPTIVAAMATPSVDPDSGEAAPVAAPDAATAAPTPCPVASSPTVPLPGVGRRSRLAALIDFGFSTRAA